SDLHVVGGVDRTGVGTRSEVLAVVQMHGRLGAIADEHVAPAGIEPVHGSAEVVQLAGGGEVDGVGPGSAGLGRAGVGLTMTSATILDQIVEDVGIDGVEAAVIGE